MEYAHVALTLAHSCCKDTDVPGYSGAEHIPVSILRKSISGRHRPVRVADGPMTARCRFTKNASWDVRWQAEPGSVH